MSPQAQTSKNRFIVQPNMCEGGLRQPPLKGRDKPGASVRPPVHDTIFALFTPDL